MRTARFFQDGRVVEARLIGDRLVDEAGRAHDPRAVHFLLPFEPRTVFGLALNYRGHAGELGLDEPEAPVLFLKPPASLVPHRAPVVRPKGVEYMHYECELAVVIGRAGRRIRPREAMDYVLGYTVANDVTVRDFVGNLFRPPVKAKGWDSFTPLGPYLVTADEIENPHDLTLRAYVNDELRQEGSTRQMIFQIPEIIAYISEFLTLRPYDVILTGTPRGLSHVHPGDLMRMEVEGIGILENPVVEEV